MKLGSVCRPDRTQSNGPTLRSLANFHIARTANFRICALTVSLQVELPRMPKGVPMCAVLTQAIV